MLGRARDQPGRGRDQADRRGDRAGAEQRRERQPPGGRARERERARQRRLGSAGVRRRGARRSSARERSCGDLAGRERQHAVGERDQRGPVGDEHHGAPARQPARSTRTTSCSVWPSRLAVGSSSSSNGASRRNARASAMRWRSPADRPAPPVAEHRVEAPRQLAHGLAQAGGGDRGARPPRSRRRGERARTFSAIDALNRCGRCGTHASRAATPPASSVGEVDAADADRAAVGREQPEQHAQQRRLAAPAGTDERQHLARLDRQRDTVERRLGAAAGR